MLTKDKKSEEEEANEEFTGSPEHQFPDFEAEKQHDEESDKAQSSRKKQDSDD